MSHIIYLRNNQLKNISDQDIEIKKNKVIFKRNCEYVIEYVDSDNIEFHYYVEDGVNVRLFLFSRDNDLKVLNHYTLGKNSNLVLFQFYDNKSVVEKSVIDF